MRIVFCGSGSTGKSTLLKELQKNPKFNNYKFFDNMTEQASKNGCRINENGDDETQKTIMSMHRNNLVYSDFIASRSAIDCLAYSLYLIDNNKISSKTYETLYNECLDITKCYDVIFYIKPEFKAQENGLRSTNQEFVESVADCFEEIIRNNSEIKVYPISGTVENRMKQIYKVLNE